MSRATYRRWLTPDPVSLNLQSAAITLPTDPILWAYIYGALCPLTQVEKWEAHGEMTPETMASFFSLVLQNLIIYRPRE